MKTNKQIKAKRHLINLHNFKECDFMELDGIIYAISKDNCMERVNDIWENLELERKERYETVE